MKTKEKEMYWILKNPGLRISRWNPPLNAIIAFGSGSGLRDRLITGLTDRMVVVQIKTNGIDLWKYATMKSVACEGDISCSQPCICWWHAPIHLSLSILISLSLSRLPHLEMCISTCQIMACVLNGNLRERSNYIIRKTERNEDELPNRATHQPTSNQAKDNINQQSLHTLTETCTNRELKHQLRNNEPNEDELPIQATQTTSTALHPKYEWPPPHELGQWLLRFRGYNDTAIPPKPKSSHIWPRHLPSRLRRRHRPLRHEFLSSPEKWRRWSGVFQTKWKSKERTLVGFVDSDTHQPKKTREENETGKGKTAEIHEMNTYIR
jgi:hypothetical protein